MEFPRDGVQQEPVRAIYKGNSLNGDYLVGLGEYAKGYTDQPDQLVPVEAAAAILPGRRAARVDLLRAITTA